jgi:hypothetical protein
MGGRGRCDRGSLIGWTVYWGIDTGVSKYVNKQGQGQ